MPRRIAAPHSAARPQPPPAASSVVVDRWLDDAARLPRSLGPEGREPLLNARERARVRAALQGAAPGVRREVLTLGRGLEGVGRALFLRAVAARAERMSAPATMETLRAFAKVVRGLEPEVLRERATVLDLDSTRNTSGFDALTLWEKRGTIRAPAGREAADDDGLLQRFTSTCGPTVLQMVLAEADPVVAFAISREGRASVSSRDGAARFQRAVLEEFGSVGIPRHESAVAARLNNALGRLVKSGAVTGAQRDALRRYARAEGPLDARAAQALAAVRARYDGFPQDRDVTALRAAVLPARDEGLWTRDFLAAFEASVRHVTGTRYRATEPEDGFARGQARQHLDAVERALARGVDVPFGIVEPAHWMLMTAVRTVAGRREFLVSDPDGGRTAWVTEKDLVSGVFGSKQFFLNKPSERPYVDCFLLPAD